MALLELICENHNGMSEEIIENITKLDSNFAPTFVDHLPDILMDTV